MFIGHFKGPFKCYLTLFSWKLDPDPPPRNANNIEHYTFGGIRKCAWRLNSDRDLELVYQLFDYVLSMLDGNTGDDDATVYKNDGRDCWTYDDIDKTNEDPRPGNRIQFDSDFESLSWMDLAAAL